MNDIWSKYRHNCPWRRKYGKKKVYRCLVMTMAYNLNKLDGGTDSCTYENCAPCRWVTFVEDYKEYNNED